MYTCTYVYISYIIIYEQRLFLCLLFISQFFRELKYLTVVPGIEFVFGSVILDTFFLKLKKVNTTPYEFNTYMNSERFKITVTMWFRYETLFLNI